MEINFSNFISFLSQFFFQNSFFIYSLHSSRPAAYIHVDPHWLFWVNFNYTNVLNRQLCQHFPFAPLHDGWHLLESFPCLECLFSSSACYSSACPGLYRLRLKRGSLRSCHNRAPLLGGWRNRISILTVLKTEVHDPGNSRAWQFNALVSVKWRKRQETRIWSFWKSTGFSSVFFKPDFPQKQNGSELRHPEKNPPLEMQFKTTWNTIPYLWERAIIQKMRTMSIREDEERQKPFYDFIY